ncbi:MAG: CDP-diacylglycerol--serine O-phosphatidyltransferase [Chromatiales bacterium]|nr:CDP-diacylglycerol--serine O-phosphatidyltransferase [Chromatiales bacterium]
MSDRQERMRVMRRRGIYLLPNLLTTGGIFAGFYGIVAAIDGHFEVAAIAIFIAGVLDGLDGRLARLTRTESEFGKQYDSLADMVAFGLAPAVIVYKWGLGGLGELGWLWGHAGWLAAFLYAVAAALRLARFNVIPPNSDRRFFEGLPSPAAAGLVMSMVWLSTDLDWSGIPTMVLAFVFTLAAGILMVSRLAYYSFKDLSPSGRIPFTYVLLIPLLFVLIALDPPLVLFIIASTYALSAVVVWLWRRQRRRARQRSGGEGGGTP